MLYSSLAILRSVELASVNPKILSVFRLLQMYVPTHLQRKPKLLKSLVHQLLNPILLLTLLKPPHATNHPSIALHAKQAFQELALTSDSLVHPREHVADVAERVVRVDLDGARETTWAAARECVHEGVEERGLAGLGEDGEGFAVVESE